MSETLFYIIQAAVILMVAIGITIACALARQARRESRVHERWRLGHAPIGKLDERRAR